MSSFNPPRSVEDLLTHIANGHTPDYLFFWGHRPSKDGSIGKSCFSQWFEAPFEVDGVRYLTAEHFMMAEKARLFDDHAVRNQILAAASPDHVKKLGRKVAGFDEARWNEARFEIVVAGNRAKFSQNHAMGQFLLATGQQVIVEASPVDRIWGIGMDAHHPDAARPKQWQGLNLLGFALMQVRAMLQADGGQVQEQRR